MKRHRSILINVSLTRQELTVFEAKTNIRTYQISSSKHGAGEQQGSYRTPRGRHIVRAKIGAGQAPGTVFVGRRPTGEVYSEALRRRFPGRDWILTRIIWLSGTEVGVNRLGSVDTMRRYIYIHGCPESEPMGVPGSIGCIRMRNDSVVELFDLIEVGTIVEII